METKKQKFIKIIKRIGIGLSLGFNIIFLIALIIGSSTSKKQVNCSLAEYDNVVEKLDIKQDIKRFVSLDGDIAIFNNNDLNAIYSFLRNEPTSSSSTFSAQESNFYVFNGDEVVVDDFNVDYDHITVDFDGEYYSLIIYESTYGSNITFYYSILSSNDYYYTFDDNEGHSYSILNGYSIIFSLTLDIDNALCNSLYQYVNSYVESSINNGIFETLTEGVTAFIGSIGSGIVAMTSVFYDSSNSQLTTIGLLSVIVVAVSLAYFLFRLLFGLIRMRG